jgi:cytochrome c oxidase subunit 3
VNFFREIAQKPWLAAERPGDDIRDPLAFALPRATLGLRVFLLVVSVIFSLFIIVYSDRMLFPDWHAMPEPWLLWPNTLMLAFASVALHAATLSVRRGRIDGLRARLWVGVAFSIAFLLGQALVWREMLTLGYFADSNPANAFFYLLTALHGLHLLGGLGVLALTVARHYGGVAPGRLERSVELCAVYWHYLLVVWLIVFGLLLFT